MVPGHSENRIDGAVAPADFRKTFHTECKEEIMKAALLVLAAGMGSRYGGLKQIDPVGPNGEIILDYSIFDAMKSGFGKVVFVIRKDIEKEFRECVGKRWENKVEVEYAFQQPDALPSPFKVPENRVKPWGTGHAVLCAKSFLKEPFAVINADDFYGRSGYAELYRALSEKPSSSVPVHFMVAFTLRKTLSEFGSVSRGICRTDAENMLTEIVERTSIVPDGNGASCKDDNGETIFLTGEEPVSMNMWGFHPSFCDGLAPLFEKFLSARGTELKSEFYLPAAVFDLILAGKIKIRALHSADSWFGVTYREDKPRVQASIGSLIAGGIYPSPLV